MFQRASSRLSEQRVKEKQTERGSLEKIVVWSSEIQKHLAGSLCFAGWKKIKMRVYLCVSVCVSIGACAALLELG